MRSLLFSILCLELLNSCSPSLFNNFARSDTRAELSSAGWFGNSDESMLFHASVDAWKKTHTGIMMIKPFGEDSHRALFMTETGIKIFDMEVYRNGNYKLHYSLEELKRRTVIKLLGNDLGLMIYPFTSVGSIKAMEANNGNIVLRIKDKRGKRYAFMDKDSGKLSELISSGILFRKVGIKYSGTGREPEKIKISHNFLNLNINLSLLK